MPDAGRVGPLTLRWGVLRASLALALVSLLGCQAPVSTGASCARANECSSPLTCAFGRCRVQCVENRDCPVGSTCLLTASGAGACALDDDPGCGPASPCASDLICVDRACANACIDIVQCPPDSTCEPTGDGRARCVRADPSDGGLRDAGTPDAAGTDAGSSCAGNHSARQLAVGALHACAIRDDDVVVCWGSNAYGQLGDGLGDGSFAAHGACPAAGDDCSPRPVVALAQDGSPLRASRIGAGGVTSCALDLAGHVQCWGQGGDGERGTQPPPLAGRAGEVYDATAPGSVVTSGAGGLAITDLALAQDTVFARRADGSVLGWGRGVEGQLGALHAPDFSMPDLGTSSTEIAAGSRLVCAIGGSRALCLGGWNQGALGAGVAIDGATASGAALDVDLLAPAAMLATDGSSTCVRYTNNALACVGNDASFQLGRPIVEEPSCTCTRAWGPPGMAGDEYHRVAVGGTAFCAVTRAGGVSCWGAGALGQTGQPASTVVRTPTPVAGLSGVTGIDGGDGGFCAITIVGQVFCWGTNERGQLGRGEVDATAGVAHPAPVEVCFD